jgi:hypothetical protein
VATLAQTEQQTGVTVFDWLAREAEVPVVTRAACQGDVSILRVTTGPATTTLPKAGAVVVRGEAGGNTHSLHGAGCLWGAAAGRGDDLVLGTLTVPEGCEAVLAHPEHGFLAIAPGTYRVGRQREFAGEWQMVAD